MKNKYFLTALLFGMLVIAGCEKEKPTSSIEKSKITGFVEKGPFVSGSKVTIYELDESLNGTGKIFESTTDDNGYFELTTLKFASKYVKLSVNGYFFNEVTGALSNSPIILEAITNIEENDQININILTHLEMERVKHLIIDGKKDFASAKEQAEKELLACFNIDKEVVPEKAGITNNDASSNILIAISSILLNGRTEAQFSELISHFSRDLKNNGTAGEDIMLAIEQSSYRLNYIQVKENILHRYQQLGKDVTIGNFQYYIDGDGDGELGEGDYPVNDPIGIETFFTSEDAFRTAMASFLNTTREFTASYFIFEALYAQSLNIAGKSVPNYFAEIYNHRVDPLNQQVEVLFTETYKAIRNYNVVIENATKNEFLKFGYAARVYRAYHYWVMTELWGDMPFMMTNINVIESIHITRTPKLKILEQLIADLSSVVPYLPNQQDGGICSKQFAEALLSRIYLSLGDFPNAGAIASQIIQSGKHSLASPQSSAFNLNHADEAVFVLDTTMLQNREFDTYIKKGNSIPLVRYAEVLLTAAEADYHQGNLSQAVGNLNLVRQRNGRTLLSSGSSAVVVLDALLEEWKAELSREGYWFFTLKRFGKAESVLGIQSYMNLLPIPRRELDLNPQMKQNPGY